MALVSKRTTNDPAEAAQFTDPQDRERVARMRSAWDAYHGKFPRPLKKTGGVDDNVLVNRCAPVVDASAGFLFGKDVKLTVTKARSKKSAQKFLDETLAANHMPTLLINAAIAGAVTGHPMLKVIPELPYPRIALLDPAIVQVQAAPDDIQDVSGYVVQFPSMDSAGEPIVQRQLITRAGRRDQASWTIQDQKRRVADGSAAPWSNDGAAVEWAHAWPPVMDWQNAPAPLEYWGRAELGEDLIQINKDINFTLSNMARILRFHSHPKMVGAGFSKSQLDWAPDGMLILPTPEAYVKIVEMQGDLHASMEFKDALEAAFDTLARTPGIALGALKDMPHGTISGVALELLFLPMLDKTGMKRRLYGDAIVELCRRVLELGGYGVDCKVDIAWPFVLPTDAAADAATASTWKDLGVSLYTILSRLGFDPDEEAERKAEEEADAPEPPPALPIDQPAAPDVPVVANGAKAGVANVADQAGTDNANVAGQTPSKKRAARSGAKPAKAAA